MGGAGGHMRHPHDLDEVQSGQDIIALFRAIPAYLRSEEFKSGQTTSLKLDGSNNAIKVVDSEYGGFQFAVDRGSLKNIDIDGITMDRVDDRFPEGHGMRPAIRTLLTILNKSIGDIQPELEALGMWDDPSLFLNTEYVEGTTNVTSYDENFLAIHGLNQF